MSAAQVRLSAPLPCPSCGAGVTARWRGDRKTAPQQCLSCGHVFTAMWPGFPMEPETVIVHAGVTGFGQGAVA